MIPAWKSGRVIVTNVRGVSAQRFAHVLNVDESEGGDVIHVDTSNQRGRLRMATWFHWAPPGALVFVDEAQAIWPKAWTQKDLQVLDYPGGSAQAEADDRPHCYSIAWEMHRHWNWDFILTTPNINKLRDEYRGCADGAYKHKNLALIGLSGPLRRRFPPPPDDTGKAQSDFISITRKRCRHMSSSATTLQPPAKSPTPSAARLFGRFRAWYCWSLSFYVSAFLLLLVRCLRSSAGKGLHLLRLSGRGLLGLLLWVSRKVLLRLTVFLLVAGC
nr:unnamed protein product [Pseudomonas sp.]